MENLTDYQNRPIRLTSERLAHILDHPEMLELSSEIAIALKQPQIVHQSNSDIQVFLYYRYYEKTLVGAKWLCIVVKTLPDDAFIITAYLTDKIKQGVEIWHSL